MSRADWQVVPNNMNVVWVHLRVCHRPNHVERCPRRSRARASPIGRNTDDTDAQRVLSPFDALSEACTEERVRLTAPQSDEDEETWEDLLDQEENAWDPTAGGTMGEPAGREQEHLPAPRQDVPEMTMAELQERLGASGPGICLLDVSSATSEEGAAEAAVALGLTRVHVPLHELHAEAAERLRRNSLVVVLPVEGGRKEQLLSWQACVRLRRVFGLDQAVVLRK